MLMQLEELRPFLRCPRNMDPVVQSGSEFVSHSGIEYPSVASQPVLVDFDNSVLDRAWVLEQGARSVLTRRATQLRKYAKSNLLHGNAGERAARNADRLVSETKKIADRPRILIVGGGTKGIGTEALYDRVDVTLASFDVYASDLTQFVADAHRIPVADQTFDGVWIQYVLEHVLEPWTVVNEIERVLKPSGVVYSESPFLQQVHEAGYDFFRFTHSGHRWLFRHFEEISSGIAMGQGPQLLWTLEHFTRGITRSRALGKVAKLAGCWLHLVDLFAGERYTYDSASSFFFMGKKTEAALSPKNIVPYYRGAH